MRFKKLMALALAAMLTVGSVPVDTVRAADFSDEATVELSADAEESSDEAALELSDSEEGDAGQEVDAGQVTDPSEDPSVETGTGDAGESEDSQDELNEETSDTSEAEEAAEEATLEEEESALEVEPVIDEELPELFADASGMILDANGGKFSDGKSILKKSSPTYYLSDSDIPSREGYVFVGWFSTANCREDENLSDESYPRRLNETPAAGTTIYAGWTDDYYTVTYDMGDGYYRNSDTGYIRETSMVYKVPKTHRLGTGYGYYYPSEGNVYCNDESYSFDKWTDDSEQAVYPYSYELTGNVTIHANYKQDKYILTYHANYGENAYFSIYGYDDEGHSGYTNHEYKTERVSIGSSYTSKSVSTDKPSELKMTVPRMAFTDWYLNKECTESPTWYSDSACTQIWTPDSGSSYRYLKLTGDTELFAGWDSTNVILSFDPNGGYFCDSDTGNKKSLDKKEFGYPSGTTISYLSIYSPRNDNLHVRFTGWFDNKDCTGDPVFDPEGSYYYYLNDYTLNSDTTYYAGWEAVYNVITYDMNGGILTRYYDNVTGNYIYDAEITTIKYRTDDDNEPYRYPDSSYIAWPDGSKAFGGWYTQAVGGDEIKNIYNQKFTEDTTVYVHWIPVYTATFDANGGRIKTNGHYNDEDEYVYDYEEVVTYKTGSGGKLTSYPSDSNVCWWSDGAVSEAKVFEGWYLNGEKITDLYNHVPASNETIIAHWVPCYTVTFDANGGKIKVNGKWNTELQQTVYEYVDSVERKTKGNGTIYNYVSDYEVVWWSNGAVSEAMVCAGWYDANDESQTLISSISSYIPEGDTVLKAKFLTVRTVTFSANGGKIRIEHWDSSQQQTIYEEFDSVERKTNKKGLVENKPYDSYMIPPENSNSLFAGWYLQGDESKTLIDFSSFVPESNVTLLAYYRPIYTITFNANGGFIKENYYDTTGSATKELNTNAKGMLESTYYVGEYYVGHSDPKKTFEGWFTEATGGEKITELSSYVFSGNTTLYAHYSSLFEVIFDATGGQIRYWDEDEGEYAYASTRNYVTNREGKLNRHPYDYDVTRESYNFIGWYLEDTSTKIDDLSSYVFTKDTTLKAHWGKKCKVTFDAGSGKFTYYDEEQGKEVTASRATIQVNDRGHLDHYPSEPVLAGKSFLGWYTASGFKIDSLWDFQPADDVTLTARYQTPFSITFDGKGGTFTYYDEEQGKYISGVKTAVIKTRGEDNYISGLPSNVIPGDSTTVFDGWYIGDRKLTSNYNEFDKSLTVTARYVKYYTVTFISMGGYYEDYNGDKILAAQTVKVPVGKSLGEGIGELRDLQNEDENVEFAGWYLDTGFGDNSQINEESYIPTKNTTVYAYWAEVHDVVFEAGFFNDIEGTIEGTTSHTIVYKVRHGEKLRYVDGAGVPGVTFNMGDPFFLDGWFDVDDMTVSKVLLSDEEILNRVVDKDITYMAQITLGRDLSFHSNGGRFLSVREVVEGCGFYTVRITTDEYHASARGKEPVVVRDDDPEHPDVHWVFGGWFYDEECTTPANLYDLNKPGYDTIDLYAGWSQCYTLTFHSNKEGATFKNGKDTVVVKVVKGETFRYGDDNDDLDVVGGNPELKTKPDDSFASRGWYTNAECTEGFRLDVGGMDGIYGFIPTEDMDFYIKWHDYSDGVDVTFDANGGVFSSSKYWWYGYGEPRLDTEHKQWTVTVPKGITWGELESITNFPYSFDSRPAGMRYNNWKYSDKECANYIRDDVLIDNDITVYCAWYPKSGGNPGTPDTYNKVTYHACEGYYKIGSRRKKTISGQYKLYNATSNNGWYGFEAPKIDDDTKIFSGWYLDPERTIPYYDGHFRIQYNWGYYSYEIRFPQEVTDLYAGYSPSYQVEFNANGGYFDDDYDRYKDPAVKMRNRYIIETKLLPGQTVIISDIIKRIRRDGDMLFGGWYTDAACTPGKEAGIYAVDNDAELFKPTANTTLYAKWIPYEKPASVSIDGDKERNIDIGTSVKLTATVTPEDGQTVTGKVHWFIAYCEYDYEDGYVQQCAKLDEDGTVTGLSQGICDIYAEVNGIRSDTVRINISNTVVENNMVLDITGSIVMYSGGARTVKATITPENLADILGGSIKWSSDKPSVVSVTPSGDGSEAILTGGFSEGEATITAKLGEITRTFTVKVLTAVKLNREEIILSATQGASTTVQTTCISALGDSLSCTITTRDGSAYEGVTIEKSGAAVAEGDKSTQNWVIKVNKDLELEYPGEAVLTASVTGTDAMIYRHTSRITLNPRSQVGAVTVNIGKLYDSSYNNAASVAKGTKVLLYCETQDSDIWYTTDGTEPEKNGASSVLFTDAVVINGNTSIRAIGVKSGRRNSAVYRFDYVVEDWGDAEDYKEAFGNNIAEVPEDIWFVIGTMVYKEVGNGATTYSRTYTGSAITFNSDVKVFNGTERLIENRDYTLSYSNNINVAGIDAVKGTKSIAPVVTIKGKGNYTKNAAFRFTIEPASIHTAEITSEKVVAVAAGPKVKLSSVKPTVAFNGKKLTFGKDYDLKYYEGTDTTAAPIDAATTILKDAGKTYTIVLAEKAGSNFEEPVGTPENSRLKVTVVTIDSKDASVTMASKLKFGNDKGKAITVPYKAADYTAAELFDNNGEDKTPAGYVYVKGATKDAFTYGVDYTITLDEDSRSAGKHSFVISGTENGRITGTRTGTYTIAEEAGMSWKSVKVAGLLTSVEYTGKAVTLDDLFNAKDKTVTAHNKDALDADKWNGVTLYTTTTEKVGGKKVTKYHALKVYDATNPKGAVLDNTYDCVISYDNTGVVGKFDLIVIGINGLSGSMKKTITVKAYNLNDAKKGDGAKITVRAASTNYSKAGAKAEVEVKYGDRLLREGIDYTVSYKNNAKIVDNYNDLKPAARPTAVIKGKGNYTGSNATAYFNIFRVNAVDAITLSVSDVVYNPKGKSGYFLAVPKLMDNGKAVTAGKNKDVDAIAKYDYAYYYAEDTVLDDADKTLKSAGESLSASDDIPVGTLIRVTVTIHISNDKKVRTKESPYLVYGAGQSAVLEGFYRFVDAGKDISKMSAAIKKGVTYNFHNGDEIIPVKTQDIQVSYKVKGQKDPVYLGENDFEIVSVSQNRFIGTATVVIRGKNGYGGTRTITFKITAAGMQ
ncbi:MAG: InlB B-repeat-containing protein [Butyrivibrio sp.]|nr:InlB B-repeat-containing protein [Butyrivibrio sp.]